MNKINFYALGAVLLVLIVSSYVFIKNHSQSRYNENIVALAGPVPGFGENIFGDPPCISGGEGATACSIGAGVEIANYGVTVECSVSCGNGFYACCSITCRCVKY